MSSDTKHEFEGKTQLTEIEELRKENEILRRQKELLELKNNCASSTLLENNHHTTAETEDQKSIECGEVKKDKSSKICFYCGKPGHFARNCRKAKQVKSNEPILRMRYVVSTTNCENKFIKGVNVEDAVIKALLDFASDCTTVKLYESIANHWEIEPCSVEINGFNGSSTLTIGKVKKTVKVDEVSMPLDIYIVDNESQSTPMILGRNFLDAPNVCLIKKFDSIEVKYEKAEN